MAAERVFGLLACGLASVLVVFCPKIESYLAGFSGFLVRPRRREHERYASTRLLPVFRYLWTCESPVPRRRVVAARPAGTVLPGSTSTRWRVHASIRSSEGPQTFIRASGCETLASALRLAAASRASRTARLELASTPERSARHRGRIHPSSAPLERVAGRHAATPCYSAAKQAKHAARRRRRRDPQ